MYKQLQIFAKERKEINTVFYKKRICTMSFAVALVFTISACKEKQTAPIDMPPTPVTVTEVISVDLPISRSFIGKVTAYDRVDIKARVQGYLEQRAFKEGSTVKKGQLLFSIEKDQYQAALKEAEANLAKAEAEAINADIQLKRAQELIKTGDIAQSILDDRSASASAALATVKQARAAKENARLDLDYTEISAPFNGRIGLSTYDVGEYITPSSGILATIVSIDPTSVIFSISMKDLISMSAKSADKTPEIVATLTTTGGFPYKHKGKIDFIDNMLNMQTDTLKMRAKFPNPDSRLIDGELVNIKISTVSKYPTIVIPQVAVQMDQAGRYVMIVKEDNKIEMRRISVGEEIEKDIIVTEGLKVGEKIVIDGLQKIKQGSLVNPTAVVPYNPLNNSTDGTEGASEDKDTDNENKG